LHHFGSRHDLGLKPSTEIEICDQVQLTIDNKGEIIRFSCENMEAFFYLVLKHAGKELQAHLPCENIQVAGTFLLLHDTIGKGK